MRLVAALGAAEVVETRGDPASIEVDAVTHDSRLAGPGTLFCCLPGHHVDGHDFAPQAEARGAVALLVERFVDAGVPQGRVANARRALALAAGAVAGRPADSLTVAHITGTDGKTTTARFLQAILEAHGWPTAMIGTLGGTGTTPDPPQLHARLAEFVADGQRAAVIEASAHGLAQHRVDGIRAAVAVFTNLSQDHLDDFATMDDYFAAKARLFTPELAAAGVVNADDPRGGEILAAAPIPLTPFSAADAVELNLHAGGSTFTWRGTRVHLQLPGRHNVMNALAAGTAAGVLGVPPAAVAAGLESVASVAGRFERIEEGQDFAVFVDYAHTPAGLEHAVAAARELVSDAGRVLVVFGAGGDRDRAKRPLMAAAVTAGADVTVLTSDNPRGEDPKAIIAEVAGGAAPGRELHIEPDRAAAIHTIVRLARPGDVVLIAGKGHETGQEIGGAVLPFDDRDVARTALAAKEYRA